MFSAEEFNSHECDLPLDGIKEIPVVYFQDESYGNKQIMTGWGIDGILYSFVVVPRKGLPCALSLSDETLQEHESDKDFTEPRTSKTQPQMSVNVSAKPNTALSKFACF